ncbi:MAG: chemotaxis protein CheW [Bacteroidales bacterium]|nr:chemotaxis protein CheW [Bacteroidales bacterium]MBN2818868.1 chemotaxis protein CheW [Bacteroidales bacterium]
MAAQKNKEGSYLSFKLGDEVFAVHVNEVLNILEMTKITAIPKAPKYLKGVINLRGMVLPVVDARIKFNMDELGYTTNTCIIVMDLEWNEELLHVGFIVDQVLEVLELDSSHIEPAPTLGTSYKAEFITGMARVNDDFVMLLNMEKIFSLNELSVLKAENTGAEVS